MPASHRVTALVEQRQVEATTRRLRELGLDADDLRVTPARAPVTDHARPLRSVRPGHLVIARGVGAVPGVVAGLAIAVGSSLALVPAAVLVGLGAALGAVAVTGGGPRAPRPAAGEARTRLDDHHRVVAHCRQGQVRGVEHILRRAGTLESTWPRPHTSSRAQEPGRPRPAADQLDTPPEGIVVRS